MADSESTTQAQTPVSYEEQLKAANEIVYKHGLELALKNKTLSLLGKLYEIATKSLDQMEMAKQVTEVIQQEFDFEVVGILRYDGVAFTPLATATSKRVLELEVAEGISHKHSETASALVMQAVKAKAAAYSEKVEDVCGVLIPKELCGVLQQDNFIRSSFAYPLFSNDQVQGVILLSLNRVSDDLVQYEKEAMASFVNVIAITLDKVVLYEELKFVNAQQENLLHFISHEVKGYLGKSAAAFAAIGEGDYGAVPDALKGMAATMLADVRKGVDTVMDILDSANLKKGTFAYNKVKFDFKKAATETVNDLQGAAAEKKLALTIEFAEGDYAVEGDEDKIRRHVLRNFVDNSIKYTPAGSVKVMVSRDGAAIKFVVEDTGVGITKEDMPRMFTEGGHGKDSLKVNVHSTGYGLFIAKQVVTAHGGTVGVESEGQGKGSRFTVTLPAA